MSGAVCRIVPEKPPRVVSNAGCAKNTISQVVAVAVLTAVQSDRPHELITACIGVGLGSSSHGMIMEHSGPGTSAQMEAIVQRMLDESFLRRGLELERVILRSVSHTVEHIGASVAAVVLWWR